MQQVRTPGVVGVGVGGDHRAAGGERHLRGERDGGEQDGGVPVRIGGGQVRGQLRAHLGDPYGEDPVEGGVGRVGRQLVADRHGRGAARDRGRRQREDGVDDRLLVAGQRQVGTGDELDRVKQLAQLADRVPCGHGGRRPAELDVPGVAEPGGHLDLGAGAARLARQRDQVVAALGEGGDHVDHKLTGGPEVGRDGAGAGLLLGRQPGAEPGALRTRHGQFPSALVDGHPGLDGQRDVVGSVRRGAGRHVQAVDGPVAVQRPLVMVVKAQVVCLLLDEVVKAEHHPVLIEDPEVGAEGAGVRGDTGLGDGHGRLLAAIGTACRRPGRGRARSGRGGRGGTGTRGRCWPGNPGPPPWARRTGWRPAWCRGRAWPGPP